MTLEAEQLTYRFFTEIGIIFQLSTTLLEDHLPGRMTSREFGMLGHLVRRPEGRTPLEIAKAFQLPKTSVTHSLSMLEARSLIAFAPNPADARSKIAYATSQADPFVKEINHVVNERLSPLVADLGVDTFASALPHLEAIRVALDGERD
ncbi:MAG: helix-turn-helix domain-containing protein [Pseudomonadota bacterium]